MSQSERFISVLPKMISHCEYQSIDLGSNFWKPSGCVFRATIPYGGFQISSFGQPGGGLRPGSGYLPRSDSGRGLKWVLTFGLAMRKDQLQYGQRP